jgi:hypothetical protein
MKLTKRCLLPGLEQRRKKLEDEGKNVPDHLKEPSLEALGCLQCKPPEDEESPIACKKCNHAFTFLVEHIMPHVIGKLRWKEEMCSKSLSDTKITTSDEAFVLLCLANMWHKWHEESNTSTRGIYTLSGTNRKYCGWSVAGLKKYNELFILVVKNWKSAWADRVEMEVQEELKSCHYGQTCLQDIRNKKVHKRGHGYNESEETSIESLPKMAWDVTSVEV